MRTATILVAAAMAVSGCAQPGSGGNATEAVVVCEEGVTRVETPAVQARPDGVHLRIDNREGGERAVYARFGSDIRHLSQAAPGAADMVVSDHGPGTWEVLCLPANAYPGEDEHWTSVEVADPQGLWVPMALGCPSPTGEHLDYREDLAGGRHLGEPRDPAELAREELPHQVPDFREGDAIEPAGYPEAVPRHLRVVRGEEVTAVAWYRFDGQGGWFFGGIEHCQDDRGTNPEPPGS